MKKLLLVLGPLLLVIILSGCGVAKTVTNPSPSITSQQQETIKPSISPQTSTQLSLAAIVPLPTGEDIIRTFFNLINEERIPEAVDMLSKSANPTDSSKQAWGISFNSFKKVTIDTLEPWDKTSWTKDTEIYKLVFDLSLKQGNNAYGWDSGNNTRWIELTKDPTSNLWKINTLATGP